MIRYLVAPRISIFEAMSLVLITYWQWPWWVALIAFAAVGIVNESLFKSKLGQAK